MADAVVAYIKPIQETIARLLRDEGYLLNVLAEGSEKASEIANVTLKEVHDKLGLSFKREANRKMSVKSI